MASACSSDGNAREVLFLRPCFFRAFDPWGRAKSTPWSPSGANRAGYAPTTKSYTYGFRIARTKGKTYVGHGGSLRGYRTIVHLCPADRIGVIVLTNADDGNPSLVADKAFEWVAPAIRKVVAPPAPNAPPAGWERYAGRYRNGWGDVQVLAVDNRLAMLDPSQPDPMLGVTWLHPVAEHAFRSETKNGFGSNGEPVVFEMGGDGRVVRLRIGENFMTPIADW